VTFLTKEKQSGDEAIKTILLANHPAFRRLATLTRTPYRVFFSIRVEMEKWLKARNWVEVVPEHHDPDSVEEWKNDQMGFLIFKANLFDKDGRLKVFTESDWHDDWITFVKPAEQSKPADDDIPF